MNRLLNTIDEWATENDGLDDEVDPAAPLRAHRGSKPRRRLPWISPTVQFKTIIWATGFRPDYSWLEVPVHRPQGPYQATTAGLVEAPGMYLMGMPFLRRRKSSLIDGAADDARDLSAHLASYLNGHRAVAPG